MTRPALVLGARYPAVAVRIGVDEVVGERRVRIGFRRGQGAAAAAVQLREWRRRAVVVRLRLARMNRQLALGRLVLRRARFLRAGDGTGKEEGERPGEPERESEHRHGHRGLQETRQGEPGAGDEQHCQRELDGDRTGDEAEGGQPQRPAAGPLLLVDGGVANNTPISTAVKLGATRIIVLPTGFACALNQMPRGAIARAMHALSLLVSRQLVHDAEQFAGGRVELRIVPSLCPLETSPYDYSMAHALIAQAKACTRQWLDDGGLDGAAVPMQLHEHHH